jgi:predicted branched-subunit amino acid permease
MHSGDEDAQPLSGLWFAKGLRASLCFSVLILALVFVAFGAFARDLGFPLWQVVLIGLSTWAMPSMVIFVATVGQGGTLAAAAIGVALSAVRLLPMTIALVPHLNTEKARRIWFYVASHFIAITAYVEAILRLPKIPPERRLSFFLGLGLGLILLASGGGVIGYVAGGAVPKPLAAGLLMLMPLFFLLSMTAAATSISDRAALVTGFALGPIAHLVEPQLDLLWAGLIGGSVGFAVHRLRCRRERA